MRKLTLVNVYCFGVKFSFFVNLFYDFEGELDIRRIDVHEIIHLLKIKLKTEKALHPVIIIGSHFMFPKEF